MLWHMPTFLSISRMNNSILLLDYPFIHYPSTEGHLGGVHLLAVVNIASVNMGPQISIQTLLSFFLYVPRSGIAGSNDSIIF